MKSAVIVFPGSNCDRDMARLKLVGAARRWSGTGKASYGPGST